MLQYIVKEFAKDEDSKIQYIKRKNEGKRAALVELSEIVSVRRMVNRLNNETNILGLQRVHVVP